MEALPPATPTESHKSRCCLASVEGTQADQVHPDLESFAFGWASRSTDSELFSLFPDLSFDVQFYVFLPAPKYGADSTMLGDDDFGLEDAVMFFVAASRIMIDAAGNIAAVLQECGGEWLFAVGSLNLYFPYTIDLNCRYLVLNRNDTGDSDPADEFL